MEIHASHPMGATDRISASLAFIYIYGTHPGVASAYLLSVFANPPGKSIHIGSGGTVYIQNMLEDGMERLQRQITNALE
ncbi:hypothetical protein AG1IA_03550 [Rhizoctonia solani AG-1 IA]|uniref:Uncharacterized protein n=1 Tax=Thanatephorus cucumeris (strain AG1-IA) TaxID=983506 RepID=L8X1C5_THACA|nr:hypothetical protein AG1IA_03550 [Rhizoctonia solani AG-1 IA]